MEQRMLEAGAIVDGFLTAVIRAGIYGPASLALVRDELLERMDEEADIIDDDARPVYQAFLTYLETCLTHGLARHR